MTGCESGASLPRTLFGIWRLDALFHKEAQRSSYAIRLCKSKALAFVWFYNYQFSHFLLGPREPIQLTLDVYYVASALDTGVISKNKTVCLLHVVTMLMRTQ